MLEDADGSLLLCDTGAWYVDACPISRVAKPEIKGTIYRVRKSGQPKVDDGWGARTDWTKAAPDALAGLLSDKRFRVRERAFQSLVVRGDATVPALKAAFASKSAHVRRAVIWGLFQVAGAEFANDIRAALGDESPQVRVAAIQALAKVRVKASMAAISTRLTSDDPVERREAATALGQIGDLAAVPALLAAAANAADRFEDHAVEINEWKNKRTRMVRDGGIENGTDRFTGG